MIKFHGYYRSSAAYRCRIAFNLKGIAYDFSSIHLRKNGGEQKGSDYRNLNPQALVPALETGGHILTQSLAIIEWLDEAFPEPKLLPADIILRARVRAFAQVIACDVHPLQNLRVLDYLQSTLGHSAEDVTGWCQRWIGDGLAACETLLEREPTNGSFSFGAEPGLADICLVPQMFSADRFGVDLSAMPRLTAVRQACEAHPAFADAHPSLQPDGE